MKKLNFIIFLSILVMGLLIGCGMTFANTGNQEELNQNSFSNIFGGGININGASSERAIEGFDGVIFNSAGNVNIHTGEKYKVIVTTEGNYQDEIITTVKDGNLIIEDKSKNVRTPKKLTVDVYMPELKNVSLKGIGDIKVFSKNASETNTSKLNNSRSNSFKLNNSELNNSKSNSSNLNSSKLNNPMPNVSELSVSLSGIGSVDTTNYLVENVNVSHSGLGEIRVGATKTFNGVLSGIGSIDGQSYPLEDANVSLSGLGEIRVGATKTFNAFLSGIGSINGQKYPLEDAKVILSGLGEINVGTVQRLEGEISGIGSIFYQGNPIIEEINITGIGNILPRDITEPLELSEPSGTLEPSEPPKLP